MKEVPAELDGMRPALERDIVVKLEVAINPASEASCRSYGREGVTQRDLRVAHITRIYRRAQEAVLRGEGSSCIRIALSARHAKEAKPDSFSRRPEKA